MDGFDLDKPVELVPVSEWVYNLYEVSYWTDEPGLDGKLISKLKLASTDSHIGSAANDDAPARANWMTWEVIRENVGQPRVIGQIHGMPMHEDARSHARRLV